MNDAKRSTSKNKTKDPLTLLVMYCQNMYNSAFKEATGQQIFHLPKTLRYEL